jgi:hypothetical protein
MVVLSVDIHPCVLNIIVCFFAAHIFFYTYSTHDVFLENGESSHLSNQGSYGSSRPHMPSAGTDGGNVLSN